MNKNKRIKTRILKWCKNKLVQKANEKGVSATEYLTELIENSLDKTVTNNLDYLINERITLDIRINEELLQKLVCKVRVENMNISEYLREIIYKDVTDNL